MSAQATGGRAHRLTGGVGRSANSIGEELSGIWKGPSENSCLEIQKSKFIPLHTFEEYLDILTELL